MYDQKTYQIITRAALQYFMVNISRNGKLNFIRVHLKQQGCSTLYLFEISKTIKFGAGFFMDEASSEAVSFI